MKGKFQKDLEGVVDGVGGARGEVSRMHECLGMMPGTTRG